MNRRDNMLRYNNSEEGQRHLKDQGRKMGLEYGKQNVEVENNLTKVIDRVMAFR